MMKIKFNCLFFDFDKILYVVKFGFGFELFVIDFKFFIYLIVLLRNCMGLFFCMVIVMLWRGLN